MKAAEGKGAVSLDGWLIDYASIWQAEVLEQYGHSYQIPRKIKSAKNICVSSSVQHYDGFANPHWPCSISICLVMRMAFSA
jgi:hypothetical protein